MMSREECEKAYLYLLKHCYEATKKNDTYDFAPSGFKESEVFKQLIEEHFDKNGNVKVLANIVIDEDKMKEIIDEEIKKLIVPEPYKFEELKPNMWVWDNVAKECLYVVRPFITTGVRVKYFTCLGLYNSLEAMKKLNMKFEENRFFPVQCANWNGSER